MVKKKTDSKGREGMIDKTDNIHVDRLVSRANKAGTVPTR